MKPETAVYQRIIPVPPGGVRQALIPGAYCQNCGEIFPLHKGAAVDGKDEEGKAYYLKCLYCETLLESNPVETKET